MTYENYQDVHYDNPFGTETEHTALPAAPQPSVESTEFKKWFGEGTVLAFQHQYTHDLQFGESRWVTGQPLFDDVIAGAKNGLFVLGAAENAGKTNLATTFYMGILKHTPNSVVVDFVLDDSRDGRIRTLVAQQGELSVRDVTLPRRLDPSDPKLVKRRDSYAQIIRSMGGRLALLDGSHLEGRATEINTLVAYIDQVRQWYPTQPLWINIDAFDDITTDVTLSDNEQTRYIVQRLKKCFVRNDCVIFCAKHLVKGSGRGAGTDALSGSRTLKYAANLIMMAYNDVGENNESADVYWEREGSDRKAPVLEVSFRKNKVGDFKGMLSYFQLPEMYLSVEVPSQDQESYRSQIAEQTGANRRRS